MLSVRKYEESDRAGVHFICHNSEGPDEVPDFSTGQFYHNTFCNYYIDHEPENCFVIDDNGRAVGYLICAENFYKFKEIFVKYFSEAFKLCIAFFRFHPMLQLS